MQNLESRSTYPRLPWSGVGLRAGQCPRRPYDTCLRAMWVITSYNHIQLSQGAKHPRLSEMGKWASELPATVSLFTGRETSPG